MLIRSHVHANGVLLQINAFDAKVISKVDFSPACIACRARRRQTCAQQQG